MLISTTNIYENIQGKLPPESHFFVDVASNRSHVRTTVVLDNASRECTFGVIAIDENRKTIPMLLFESFQISTTGTEWFSMKPIPLRDQTIFVGPDMKHVKEVIVAYRPSVALHGGAVTLRVVLFEKGTAMGFCDSPVVKISKPSVQKPQHPRVVQLQQNGLWETTMDEFPSFPVDTFETKDCMDDELGELADFDMDVFMDEAARARIEKLEAEILQQQCTIMKLEEDLQKSRENKSF